MASNNIKKLTPYQHVRLRTTVYYGSTSLNTQPVLAFDDKNKLVLVEESWVPAVFTCFREILDNSLDEVVAHGHGNRIDVDFDPSKMRFEIRDNGRGIPFDWDEEHKMHKATLALSELMAGRNFEDRGDTAGMNGIGASGVNFCSVEFIVESRRDGQKFIQRFEEGDEVFGDSLQIFDPKITKYSGTDTGTTITFQLSRKVFSDLTLPENFIRSRVMEVAVCNPHVKFYYNGQHIKVKPRPEQTLFPGKDTIQIDINEEGFKAKFWVIPNFTESGDHSHSIVNNIPAFNGGIQIDTFKRLFIGNLISGLERESKKRKLTPNRSDVSEGLLIFNITRMTKPDFDSQSKTRLINDEVGGILKKHLENPDLYKEIIKKHKSWIDEIYQRCADRTQKKDASEIAKLARKLVRAKVPGLMDATGRDRMKCTLFLAEGLSAISGMAAVRDPDIHGGLGLKGKVMNVNGSSPKKVIESKALSDIMNAMGLVIGEKADRSKLKYGKIYIATDQDQDGANIASLLVNFFYTYWPELFQNKIDPVVHMFMTPFIIAEKGKTRKYWYSHDYQDFKPEDYSGWSITRAKGLGTLTKEDWKQSLSNPVTIPISDDGNLQESLDLIFNDSRSDDRKVWIGL